MLNHPSRLLLVECCSSIFGSAVRHHDHGLRRAIPNPGCAADPPFVVLARDELYSGAADGEIWFFVAFSQNMEAIEAAF